MNPFTSFTNSLFGKSSPSSYKSLSAPAPVYKSLNAPPASFQSLSGITPPTPSTTPSATVPVTKSPAKSQYLSTLTPSGGTVENINGGQVYSNPMDNPAYVSKLSQSSAPSKDTYPDIGTTSDVTTSTSQPPVPQPPTDPLKDYAAYLKGYQDTANTANTRLADIQNKSESAQTEARRAYEAALDTPGELKGGAQQSASVLDSRNNRTLADIALQESAASRSANVAQTALGNAKPLQIGDNYYDPSTGKLLSSKTNTGDSFTLGAGDTRYVLNPDTGQYQAISNSPSSAASYQPGTNPTVDSWVSQVQSGLKITDVPKQYQDQVSQAITSAPKPISEASQGVLSIVDELLNSNTDVITGVPGITSFIPGTEAQKTKNLYDQLKGMLSLQNRTQLKGSGAISDFESKTLEKAASSLGTNLSNGDFKKTLQDLRDTLASNGNKAGGQAPQGGSVFAESW